LPGRHQLTEVDSARLEQAPALAKRGLADGVEHDVVALLVGSELSGGVVEHPIGAEVTDEADVRGGTDGCHGRADRLEQLDGR